MYLYMSLRAMEGGMAFGYGQSVAHRGHRVPTWGQMDTMSRAAIVTAALKLTGITAARSLMGFNLFEALSGKHGKDEENRAGNALIEDMNSIIPQTYLREANSKFPELMFPINQAID